MDGRSPIPPHYGHIQVVGRPTSPTSRGAASCATGPCRDMLGVSTERYRRARPARRTGLTTVGTRLTSSFVAGRDQRGVPTAPRGPLHAANHLVVPVQRVAAHDVPIARRFRGNTAMYDVRADQRDPARLRSHVAGSATALQYPRAVSGRTRFGDQPAPATPMRWTHRRGQRPLTRRRRAHTGDRAPVCAYVPPQPAVPSHALDKLRPGRKIFPTRSRALIDEAHCLSCTDG